MKPNFESIRTELILAARRGEEAEASYLIPLFLGLLEQRLAAMPQDKRAAMEKSLAALLKAQSDGDWVLFADLVEADGSVVP